ncbi:MAG TPA: hypothetical protein VF669_15130, partial [Tepidisphaeraceae bacterium]
MPRIVMLALIGLIIGGCAKWKKRPEQARPRGHSAGAHVHTAPATAPATELEPGLGNHYHPTSTKSRLAQRFFDQGLTLYYGFNHDAAIRAFKRAAELDPNFAMAHWGIALSLGPNYNMGMEPEAHKAALASVQTAARLGVGAPQQERDYIAALEKRYSADPKADLQKLNEAYAGAMRELMKKYPYDTDAATLFAESMMDLRPWKLWTAEAKPEPGTLEIVAVLEDVLARDPEHIGANHFYIHAVEASEHPEKALVSAKRLPSLAPAAGHLVHMPAHVYQRIGNYDESAKVNEQAAKVDEVYLQNHPAPGVYSMMYYSHNLHFAAVAHAVQGRFRDARSASDQLYANVKPHLKEMGMLESFAVMPALIPVRCAQWDEALKVARPEDDQLLCTAAYHFARGMALAAKGNVDEAERERDEFLAVKKRLPKTATWGSMAGTGDVLIVAQHLLEAKILSADGDHEAAVALLSRAVKEEDRLPYDEPPVWIIPTRE